MRKIEKKLNQAIAQGKPFKLENTRLDWENNTGYVFLHNNLLAVISRGEAYPIPATFSAWPTRTTASRLRALGICATIRQGQPYIDGVAV